MELWIEQWDHMHKKTVPIIWDFDHARIIGRAYFDSKKPGGVNAAIKLFLSEFPEPLYTKAQEDTAFWYYISRKGEIVALVVSPMGPVDHITSIKHIAQL